MTDTIGETLENLRQLLRVSERLRADALERGNSEFATREAEQIAALRDRLAALEAKAASRSERGGKERPDSPSVPQHP